ncbi:transcription initiation factor IIA subunit 2-like [Drosophila obscura]|uniref:transcription initiation factor IIA subunit 2-like n=1 Tax=Drosophila obscura TaxID=7282 RepID=UPI001BB2C0A1|nr:transcription initiation factor IIA subunit 2-like [Drosophila obscura]
MSKQLYRSCTLGDTLQDTLDELIQNDLITPALAHKVLIQYDKSIIEALKQKAKANLSIKAKKLRTYNLCDNVWSLKLEDVEIRELHEIVKVDKVKIVATEAPKEDNKK